VIYERVQAAGTSWALRHWLFEHGEGGHAQVDAAAIGLGGLQVYRAGWVAGLLGWVSCRFTGLGGLQVYQAGWVAGLSGWVGYRFIGMGGLQVYWGRAFLNKEYTHATKWEIGRGSRFKLAGDGGVLRGVQ